MELSDSDVIQDRPYPEICTCRHSPAGGWAVYFSSSFSEMSISQKPIYFVLGEALEKISNDVVHCSEEDQVSIP